MKDPKRIITSSNDPIVKFNNHSYMYRYDLKRANKEDEEIPLYSCIQVKLKGTPSYKDVVRGVIRKYISVDEEFDIINNYNRANLGLIKSNDDYNLYLNLIEQIKTNVKNSYDWK